MSPGYIITRGFLGNTMVTRGYGHNSFSATIIREVIRLTSYIKQTLNLESYIGNH